MEQLENYLPSAIAKFRSGGGANEFAYQAMKADHARRGAPPVRANALSTPPPDVPFSAGLPEDFPQYECFLPCALAELRSQGPAGEATYRGMRSSWRNRSEPPLRADASSIAPPVHPFAAEFVASAVADRKFEDYSAFGMSELRASGELSGDEYEELRADWIHRGSPPIKTV